MCLGGASEESRKSLGRVSQMSRKRVTASQKSLAAFSRAAAPAPLPRRARLQTMPPTCHGRVPEGRPAWQWLSSGPAPDASDSRP